MNKRTRVRTRVAVMTLVGTLVAGSAAAQGRQAASPVPDGFVKYMVFMMNGIFDPAVPSEDTAEFYQKFIRPTIARKPPPTSWNSSGSTSGGAIPTAASCSSGS